MNENNIERGIFFEQILREMFPWTYRPPVSTVTKTSEQIDAIFVWKDYSFIVEAKAKKNKITEGSHDWEDFELKVRRRKGIIGLFCNLFSVSEKVIEAANRMNQDGFTTILLHGNMWDELKKYNLSIIFYIEHMIEQARIFHKSVPDNINMIYEIKYKKDNVENQLFSTSKKMSSNFFRRYMYQYFVETYVNREIINKYLESHILAHRPSSLMKNVNDKDKQNYQVCIIRDISGSGKTSLSLSIANHKSGSNFIGFGDVAEDIEIDKFLINVMQELSSENNAYSSNDVLHKLISINKPLVFVIDSLDEAYYEFAKKRKEIKALFKYLDELNTEANKFNLSEFPIFIIFTVRDDYWRDWESLFEKPRVLKIHKKNSYFNDLELDIAIEKFSMSYKYTISNDLVDEQKDVLRLPFNMLIFSETYEFQREIVVYDIWEHNLLSTYFSMKENAVYKHKIAGLNGDKFIVLLSIFAWSLVTKNTKGLFKYEDFKEIITVNFSLSALDIQELFRIIHSEHIFIASENNQDYRFRHMKFIEYLSGVYIVNSLNDILNDIAILDVGDRTAYVINNHIDLLYSSKLVNMNMVHKVIRNTSKIKSDKLYNLIEKYYSNSDSFMIRKLISLRADIAGGSAIVKEDADLIFMNCSNLSPHNAWQAFFVIVAKNVRETRKNILHMFSIAWESNKESDERKKLLEALTRHNGFIVDELVIMKIRSSNNRCEHESFLFLVLINNHKQEFINQLSSKDIDNLNKKYRQNNEWIQCLKMFEKIMSNDEYIVGDFNY